MRAFGVVPSFAAVLAEIEGIAEAYVFGSWAARATGRDGIRPVGDVDVLILGTPDRDRLYEAIHDLEDRLGRPVQVTIRDTGWLADGEGSFHDTVTSRPMVAIPLSSSSA